MESLPFYILLAFILSTLLTVLLFYKSAHYSSRVIIILTAWLLAQAVIALTGFYTITDSIPPRFLLLVLPPFIFIAILFLTTNGRQFIDNLNLKTLTLLHIIRVPVEMVLYWLFLNGAVAELMTFEGRNFDIFSGLTAPVVYYFGFVRKVLHKNVILIWNFICLGLLINIVANAALSVPSPFQQLAFDQPNIAILYFPYNWLPSCVVPIVFLSHLAAVRQFIRMKYFP